MFSNSKSVKSFIIIDIFVFSIFFLFTIYSGNDDQVVALLSLGGKGVISVAANIIPEQMHNIVSSYLDKDVETSRDIQLNYIALMNSLFCEVNPIPVKAAMNLLGMNVGGLRKPLTDLEVENIKILEKELIDSGLL